MAVRPALQVNHSLETPAAGGVPAAPPTWHAFGKPVNKAGGIGHRLKTVPRLADTPLGILALFTHMKYDVIIEGKSQRSSSTEGGWTGEEREGPRPVPVARRYPPVVQLLTQADPSVEYQLSAFAKQSYKQGKPLKDICRDLYHFAHSLGFEATIGVQEVYSASMPSFPGQTVISALLMIDIRPLWMKEEVGGPRMGYAS